jgi:hAT family C-terminal dimerisation region
MWKVSLPSIRQTSHPIYRVSQVRGTLRPTSQTTGSRPITHRGEIRSRSERPGEPGARWLLKSFGLRLVDMKDPLVWWKEHQTDYHILACTAFDALSTPAMNSEVDRAFSAANKLISDERNCLGSGLWGYVSRRGTMLLCKDLTVILPATGKTMISIMHPP